MIILPMLIVFAAQIADILLHIASNQFEPIRFASNLVAAFGAIAMWLVARHARTAGLIAGAMYLLLNAVFIAQNGVSNPITNTLRLPLFGFMAVTLILLFWTWLRAKATDIPIK